MSLSILLTSDLHLGMKFATLPAAQAELAEARYSCLKRLVDLANTKRCDLLVVAGDLFERISIPRREAERAAAMLRDFQGRLVAVLPGNHDFTSPDDDLWRRFRESSGDAVLLLDEPRPYPLAHYGLDACLYPGPCVSKHSAANAIGWVRASPKDPAIRHHIGVAHGSLEGLSPDFDGSYYPMKPEELLSSGMELWLLGHTHMSYPKRPSSADRIFCAGTPEPDGFDCSHDGAAWLIRLEEEGAPVAEALPTGTYRFVREELRLREVAELDALEERASRADGRKLLMKAVITGRLSPEARAELEGMRARLSEKLLLLEWDESGLREEITAKAVDREFPAGSFPHRLLKSLVGSADEEAIELAYELLQEARR